MVVEGLMPSGNVFFEDGVEPALLDIIRSATDHIVLVSPYNKFWIHLRDELTLASQRGVKIIFLYRADETLEDLAWLTHLNAQIYAVDRLHAKIFLNESSVLVTSMNLLETSSKNSKEIAIRIDDPDAKREVRSYVLERLIPLSKIVAAKPAAPAVPKPRAKTRPSARKPAAPPQKAPVGGILGKILDALIVDSGVCIRCATKTEADVERPLCGDCYASWSRYGDRDYKEHFCHRCAEQADTSFAKPLCYTCYKVVNK